MVWGLAVIHNHKILSQIHLQPCQSSPHQKVEEDAIAGQSVDVLPHKQLFRLLRGGIDLFLQRAVGLTQLLQGDNNGFILRG